MSVFVHIIKCKTKIELTNKKKQQQKIREKTYSVYFVWYF